MYTTIVNADTLQQHLNDPDWLLIDCRFSLADSGYGKRLYGEGHIPGARYLDLDEDLSSAITPQTGRHPMPDADALSTRLKALGLKSGQQVVVYDDCSGMMAARAWWLLRWLGHERVALLDGGLSAWKGELSADNPLYEAGNFEATPRNTERVELAAVEANLDQPRFTLIDARSAERYRGEQEPIDPVAGHIPGALNRPLTDNLRDGVFKSAGELHAEWKAVLGDTPASDIVHMCGSGVTACHNLLAMEIAGLCGSRIYAGSWSEWIRNPKHPVISVK
ncbi:sulfurtransferase [Marinobacterium jannaschii]|uniref:sulfurtransferase n=1 Tax=Marinobacterium jannaschii TaxID=64970 RepID=UPI0004869701|nr:sulfurtransferase [Marinobacterium jannaschii]